MKSSIVAQLHSDFEGLVQTEEDTGVEFWMARGLQEVLGYARWENFTKVITKARTSCIRAGYGESDHVLDVRKMIASPQDWRRDGEDIMLTQHAWTIMANGNTDG